MLGSYSATAPFDCPKSKRILEQGCKALAEQSGEILASNEDPIVRSLNALALLASGNPAYLPLVKKEAEWAAGYSSDSMQTWHYGYVMMLLSEYVMATGDQSVMPGLRRLALEAAKGQSAVGSWGHGFAIPDGRLGGYGMMNSPGVPLTISLVMAREAGVKDPAVDLRHRTQCAACCDSTSAKARFPTATITRGLRTTTTTASAEWPPSCSTCSAKRKARSFSRA